MVSGINLSCMASDVFLTSESAMCIAPLPLYETWVPIAIWNIIWWWKFSRAWAHQATPHLHRNDKSRRQRPQVQNAKHDRKKQQDLSDGWGLSQGGGEGEVKHRLRQSQKTGTKPTTNICILSNDHDQDSLTQDLLDLSGHMVIEGQRRWYTWPNFDQDALAIHMGCEVISWAKFGVFNSR